MKKISIISGLILLIQTSFGQTTIVDNSNISGTWTVADSPYIIEGRAIVPNGETLTIEPGVEVRLRSSSSPTVSWFDYEEGNVGVIRVNGEIIANGTAEDKILFTRDNTGYWGTILIDEDASTSSAFTNCIIEYSKESRNVTGIASPVAFDAGISIYKTAINFEKNELRENQSAGMYVVGVSTLFEFNDNVFHDNGADGLVISESTANSINNAFYDNSYSATGSVSAIKCSFSEVYLVGNLIYNNDDFGIYTTTNGNVHIVNNTIFGNDQGIRVEDGANTYITNSIIQNNSTNFATSGPIDGAIIEMQYSLTDDATFPTNVSDVAGNILDSTAAFTDSDSEDFSLQSSSPCIDKGKPDTAGLNIPDSDILENNRIDNDTIDIGAVEYQYPLGINESGVLVGLKIYPNPTNNIVNIIYNEALRISVFSMDGRALGTYTSKEIDLSNQNNGIYLLKIENSNGDIAIRRVVKK